MKYSGIDLHSNNSVVTVTDEEDRVVVEKRLSNDLAKVLELLLPWREELAGVVVESTFNWYWLVDGLQAAGFKVHLALQFEAISQFSDEEKQTVRDLLEGLILKHTARRWDSSRSAAAAKKPASTKRQAQTAVHR